MQGSVITLDVSKGSCHYQGFIRKNQPSTKTRILKFTKKSFAELSAYRERLAIKAGQEDIPFIFEATGVYHKPLQKYLDDHGFTYYIISPLMSARYRKLELHSNKTDPLDCANIAKLFYEYDKLRVYQRMDKEYESLRDMNRNYEDMLVHLRKYKVRFKSMLDVIFPYYQKCFKNDGIYADLPLILLKEYKHPDIIHQTSEDIMVKKLSKLCPKHQTGYIRNKVQKVKELAEDVYSGCESTDIYVELFTELIETLQKQMKECDEQLIKIIETAAKSPYFDLIRSVVGIGDNLAARILAEIGDINQFDTRNKLISYAGLDPMIRQSGKKDGIHLSVSKKGNRYLRCLLYQAASANYRLKKNDVIYRFNQKKRQQSNPLNSKAANTATAHKILVIVYGMCKNGTYYNPCE